MNGKYQRPFVYGKFRSPRPSVGLVPPPHPYLPGVPGEPDIALEVLREFGASDLIGKIYVRTFGATPWVPAQWDLVQSTTWYQDYLRLHGQHFFFDMAGSGTWQVVHFRTETDETGPYVAVALQYQPKTPAWVVQQRERERSR